MEVSYTEKEAIINGETFGDNTVAMLLYGNIDHPNPDGSRPINSTEFVKEMNYYNSLGKHVVVKINSNGGSVYGGLAIMEAIEDNGADTYVVGMAGSIAGVILQAGKQRYANKRASWMAHAPTSKGGQASKKHINIVRDMLKNSLVDRSVLNEGDIEKIMNGKDELYYSAMEMYDNGLVDRVIESGVTVDLQPMLNLSADELYTAYDSLLNNKTKPIKMENLMNHLGLENKTEADVLNIVKDLEVKASKVDELETEVTNLKEENETLKNEAETLVKEQATTLIVNAIEAGKIKEDSKDKWIEMAISNMSLTSEALDGLSTTKKATTVIANVIEKKETQKTDDKDYEWYQKNEPQTLVNMFEEDREKFEELEAAYKVKNNILN